MRTTSILATIAAVAALAGCGSSVPADGGASSATVLDTLTAGLGAACETYMEPDEVASNSYYARKADDVTAYAEMRYCYADERSSFTALVYTFDSDDDLEAAQRAIDGGYGGYGRGFSSEPGAETPWLAFTGSDDYIPNLLTASAALGGVRDAS